jgi:hypothetical protein
LNGRFFLDAGVECNGVFGALHFEHCHLRVAPRDLDTDIVLARTQPGEVERCAEVAVAHTFPGSARCAHLQHDAFIAEILHYFQPFA